MGQHDGPIGDEVGSHLARLREVCAVVLEEVGVGHADLKIEAEGLRALIVGLLVLLQVSRPLIAMTPSAVRRASSPTASVPWCVATSTPWRGALAPQVNDR